jgi:hypothetical protein
LARGCDAIGSDAHPKAAPNQLDDWASPDKGWLRKFQWPGTDEARFDLTPATEMAIAWLPSLTEQPLVGTESRLLTLFALLEQIPGEARCATRQTVLDVSNTPLAHRGLRHTELLAEGASPVQLAALAAVPASHPRGLGASLPPVINVPKVMQGTGNLLLRQDTGARTAHRLPRLAAARWGLRKVRSEPTEGLSPNGRLAVIGSITTPGRYLPRLARWQTVIAKPQVKF